MSNSKRLLGRITLLGVLAFNAGAHAQSGPGAADAFSYRCHLLGEAGACAVLEASQRGLPLPGPYALALIGKGVGRDQAIAAAAALGERPVVAGPAKLSP